MRLNKFKTLTGCKIFVATFEINSTENIKDVSLSVPWTLVTELEAHQNNLLLTIRWFVSMGFYSLGSPLCSLFYVISDKDIKSLDCCQPGQSYSMWQIDASDVLLADTMMIESRELPNKRLLVCLQNQIRWNKNAHEHCSLRSRDSLFEYCYNLKNNLTNNYL